MTAVIPHALFLSAVEFLALAFLIGFLVNIQGIATPFRESFQTWLRLPALNALRSPEAACLHRPCPRSLTVS